MPNPISCERYDYLEIACLYAYRVRLTLYSGEIVEGKAITTSVNSLRKEVLVLDVGEQQQVKKEVETEKLKTLDVLTANARFKHMDFS